MKALALSIAVLFVSIGAMTSISIQQNISEELGKDIINYDQNSFEIAETIEISNVQCATLVVDNQPIVPVYSKQYTLPAGSSYAVTVTPNNIQNIQNKELAPGDIHCPPGFEVQEGTYDETSTVFPQKWFSYDVKGGIVDGIHVSVITVYLFPERFIEGTIKTAESFDVTISYEEPQETMFTNDVYDLLIICPNAWEAKLEEFATHKEGLGIKTKIVCVECMLAGEYFDVPGRDTAEKIKYFIKYAVEEWGIEYVLLVGGRKPGIQEDWLLPVRYVYVYWADEFKYVSDLYFADIYDGNYSFSSWDSDGNDVFSEWERIGSLKDEVDLMPDVYLGRWACRSGIEVDVMIEKTIAYESTTSSNSVVLAGGDNFEMDGIEGEIVCDKTLSYLPGFEGVKVYASLGDVTSAKMKAGLDDGAAFIHLHGHGSPIYWSTHQIDDVGGEWEDGLKFYDLPMFFNSEYPIAVVGGCHTAMFNVSMTVHAWTGGIPSPEGISWWFARKINGGAIASLGYTAFPVATPGEDGDLDGDGINDPDCAESGYGFMQLEFFKAYGVEGKQYLGECWAYAEGSYTETFKIPYQRYHLHTIQAFVLLGDPSMKIGGY